MFFKSVLPPLVPGWKLVVKGSYSGPDVYLIPESLVLEVCTDQGNQKIRFRLPGQPDRSGGWIDLSRDGQITTREIEASIIISLERCEVSDFDFKPGPSHCALTTAVVMQRGTADEALLDRFRRYRSGWLESHTVGRFLSRLYNVWGPPIAAQLPARPRFTSFMGRCFIDPCAFLLNWSEGKPALVAIIPNILVMLWYVVGTCTAKTALAFTR